MNILGALILFAVFIFVYVMIVEIFTVLFRLTGLTREKARTQVISMLTNSGFTTSESEIFVSSHKRRRLTQITILFGYSFTVIIVSILINVFLALNQSEVNSLALAAAVTVGLCLIVFCIMRIKRVRQGFDHLIERLGNRFIFGKGSNALVLADSYGDKAMVEIRLDNLPEFLDGVRMADSGLKENYRIQIMLIKRGGETIDHIDGNTLLMAGDRVFVFGLYKSIRTVFEHPDSGEKTSSSGKRHSRA